MRIAETLYFFAIDTQATGTVCINFEYHFARL